MISVVMATYNSMKYIKEQLESIRRQTIKVDEVIIVDDCSTDGTVSFLETYISENNLSGWLVYKHKTNLGYIHSFTDALKYCNGDVIILCDHDDIWFENKVEVIISLFNNNANMQSLNTGFIQIDSEGKEISVKLKHNHANNNLIRRNVSSHALNKMSYQDVAVYNISPGCTCAISKCLKDLFLIEEHKIPHDWKLNILAACFDGLYFLDIPTTKYRIHGANTIGLGHQTSYKIRKGIVERNLEEKQEAIRIVSKYGNANNNCLKYYKGVEEIFKLRNSFMNDGRIIIWIRAFYKSLNYGRLYESVILDLISRLKSRGTH